MKLFDSLKRVFGERALAALQDEVRTISELDAECVKLSDEEMRATSEELRRAARGGEPLDRLLPRAFALAREAARRTLGQRPYDVQLMGGIVLHRGGVAEMVTGEGKTLAAVAPAYLNALTGKGVHIVTVNEYLARRDAVWMGQIYDALGSTVACLVPNASFVYDPSYVARKQAEATSGFHREQAHTNEKRGEDEQALLDRERDTRGSFLVQQDFLRPVSRKEAYGADITYGTNHEFGFDYLRDNLAYQHEDQVQFRVDPHTNQREPARSFAVIDEVDNILIDEARTPLIIAAPDTESSELYKTFTRVVARLEKDVDYTVDEKHRSAAVTDAGIEKIEKMIGVPNLYAPEHFRLVHFLEESLRARALFHKDKEYVVKNNEVIIVDEFTGRMLHGRRYSGGLHQAIEAKEGVFVKEESRTYAKISIQNYFRLYKKIAGMTGTAQTSAEEFHKVYNLDVVSIPTHHPLVRKDFSDVIYKSRDAKWDAVVQDIEARHKEGQPVLVGTTSIEKNEHLSGLLSRAGIPHEVLNAKNNEREGAIIAQAGRLKAVTVATNMAGRGVDIILGGNPSSPAEAEQVRSAGGLHVIGTERHEARRIDNQLRGRSGRQGDPGSSQFYLSLEDDLLRIFGGDRIKALMERFDMPDNEPIQIGFVSKAVAQAQAKVEGANFDLRKHLLEYDDVLNKQRSLVYKRRQEILEIESSDAVSALVFDAAYAHLTQFERAAGHTEEDLREPEKATSARMVELLSDAGAVDRDIKNPNDPAAGLFRSASDFEEILREKSRAVANHPQARTQLLGMLDLLWMNHLENLEALSESVGLRAYGHKDPLVEYRQEARRLFADFWDQWNGLVCMNIFKLMANGKGQIAKGDERGAGSSHSTKPITSGYISNSNSSKIGRNDPCPCGAVNPKSNRPYKYKHCGLINAAHHGR